MSTDDFGNKSTKNGENHVLNLFSFVSDLIEVRQLGGEGGG